MTHPAPSEITAPYAAPQAPLLSPESVPQLVVRSLTRGWLSLLGFSVVAVGVFWIVAGLTGYQASATTWEEVRREAERLPHRDMMRVGFWCFAMLWTGLVTGRRAGRHGLWLGALQGALFSLPVGLPMLGLRVVPVEYVLLGAMIPCAALGGWIGRRSALRG